MADGACTFLTYPSSDLDAHPVPAGFVLLHETRPRWLAANATAAAIAESLASGESAGAVAARLASAHGVSLRAVIGDVAQVRERLFREGFLAHSPSAPLNREPSLRSVYLHVTNRCNLACPHCYYPAGPRPADLPAPLVERLVDEAAANGGRAVSLSGGEALLHPSIRSILEHAAPRLSVRLLTNGTLLDGEWARLLAGLNVQVQVSLDGASQEVHDRIRGPGTFEKALRAVSALQEAGLGQNLILSATVMKQNVGSLQEIIVLARRLGVPKVRFLPLSRRGRAAHTWEETGSAVSVEEQEAFYDHVAVLQRGQGILLDVSCGLSGFMLEIPESHRADEIWCSVGGQVVVDVEGGAFPCVLLMREPFRLGDVHETGLVGLVRSRKMREVCNTLTERKTAIPLCSACAWQNFCQAGCMGQALDNKGTVWDTDVFCSYRKNAYRRAFDRILELEEEGTRC